MPVDNSDYLDPDGFSSTLSIDRGQEELAYEYAAKIADNMSTKDLMNFVIDVLGDGYVNDYTHEQLVTEIRENYPELLD